MYEEKTKRFNINFKSVLIKMAILLVVVFVFLWIVSLFTNKKDDKSFDLQTNLKFMKEAASDYFTGVRLPSHVNSKKKITLAQMYEEKLLTEMDGACDTTESYAEATKISESDYNIKVKIVCGDKTDYVINTISVGQIDDNTTIVDTDNEDKNDSDVNDNEIVDNKGNNSSNNSSSNNLATNTGSTNNNNDKNNNNSNTSNNVTVNQVTSSVNSTNSCKYGNKEYSASYPLAYVISGNCAASKDDYTKYANEVNKVGIREYQKIVSEMAALGSKTGSELVVEQPIFSAVYNKANTGLVGYQIKFKVVQNFVWKRTIYEYYIDQNGNRTVVTDDRRILSAVTVPSYGSSSNSTNNNSSSNAVTSVTLDKSSLRLAVGDYYTLRATVNPSNATNKTVTWSSSDRSVAVVSTSGKVTAKSAGVATITASAGGKSVSIRVTVENIEVTNITLNRTSVILTEGDIFDLVATIAPSNATNKDIRWSSNNERVATVNSSGRVIAKYEGTAIITAKVGNKSATARITVEADTQTYTNTYYVMNYISSKDVGNTLNQKFIFKDISKSARVTNVRVAYFDESISDYQAYANENWDRKIELYSGFNKTGYEEGIKLLEYFNFSLNSGNYRFSYNSADYGNYHGININTTVSNLRNAVGFNDLYFVPLKITVTYEI